MDADLNHICDYGCDEAIGICADADKDHKCDYGCGKTFGVCSGGTATCKDLAVCAYCGLEYGEKNPENHVGGTKIRKGYGASCTEDGYTGNTYCRSCGEELAEGEDIASFGHTYEKLVTDTATVTYRCKVCGDSYTEHSAAPQTGDASPVERTMAAAMLSGLALALMLVWNRKRSVK